MKSTGNDTDQDQNDNIRKNYFVNWVKSKLREDIKIVKDGEVVIVTSETKEFQHNKPFLPLVLKTDEELEITPSSKRLLEIIQHRFSDNNKLDDIQFQAKLKKDINDQFHKQKIKDGELCILVRIEHEGAGKLMPVPEAKILNMVPLTIGRTAGDIWHFVEDIARKELMLQELGLDIATGELKDLIDSIYTCNFRLLKQNMEKRHSKILEAVKSAQCSIAVQAEALIIDTVELKKDMLKIIQGQKLVDSMPRMVLVPDNHGYAKAGANKLHVSVDEVVKMIQGGDLDLRASNIRGNNALEEAMRLKATYINENVNLIKVLHEAKFDVNEKNYIKQAVVSNNIAAIKALKECGAIAIGKDLCKAVEHRDIRQVELMLYELGVPVDVLDDKGNTSLYYAASQEWPAYRSDVTKLVKLLLKRGANANFQSNDGGLSPLHYSAKACNIEMTDALIQAGAEVKVKDNQDNTLLHYVAQGKYIGDSGWLAQAQVYLKPVDDKVYEAEINAENEGCQLIKKLVERGVSPNHKNKKGLAPLHEAADRGYVAMVQELLNYCDINQLDDSQDTILHIAAFHGHTALAQMLITRLVTNNDNVDKKNHRGNTPLYLAASGGHKDIVELLITQGKANVDKANNGGNTPLIIAALKGHDEIVSLLIENCQSDADNKDQYTTALFKACRAIYKKIGEHQADLDQINEGNKILLAAQQQSYVNIAIVLIAQGASVNVKDDDGLTPLSGAANLAYTDMVNILLQAGAVAQIDKHWREDIVKLITNSPYQKAFAEQTQKKAVMQVTEQGNEDLKILAPQLEVLTLEESKDDADNKPKDGFQQCNLQNNESGVIPYDAKRQKIGDNTDQVAFQTKVELSYNDSGMQEEHLDLEPRDLELSGNSNPS
jgi:ankyrin repeat protein